jgi:DNA repair protein RadA/Sms
MERPVRDDVLVVGEVGLTGEVRAVTAIETRLREGAALGFQRAVVPASNLAARLPLEVEGVATVTEALEMLVR